MLADGGRIVIETTLLPSFLVKEFEIFEECLKVCGGSLDLWNRHGLENPPFTFPNQISYQLL